MRWRISHSVLETEFDQLVPAALAAASRRLEAGDDEALRGARHRDIEQAAVFGRFRLAPFVPRHPYRPAILDFSAPGKKRRLARGRAEAHQPGILPFVRRAARV